jgi:hypothetical protein
MLLLLLLLRLLGVLLAVAVEALLQPRRRAGPAGRGGCRHLMSWT